jgi:hypothetical protein|tara:strand:- start:2724 stop:3140 length:417 start_codon:yes stop_codon:yes gene_type:complete
MADAVTSQTIEDGGKNLIVKITNISDGTGESAVAKIDVSALNSNPTTGAACSRVSIQRIWFSNIGMGFKLFWKASSNQFIFEAPADFSDTWDFSMGNEGKSGIPNNAGTGVNGDLLLTTVNHTDGDTYSAIIWAHKHY